MNVENILKEKGGNVFTVTEDARVSDAVEVLNTRNIGVVIVVNAKGAPTGVLSERDVIRRLTSDTSTVMLSPVTKCMTPKPITCTPETTVDEAMQTMSAKRIRHLPVVSGGALAGMISIGDVVKRKIAQAEEEAAALRDYIAS